MPVHVDQFNLKEKEFESKLHAICRDILALFGFSSVGVTIIVGNSRASKGRTTYTAMKGHSDRGVMDTATAMGTMVMGAVVIGDCSNRGPVAMRAEATEGCSDRGQ